MNLEGTCESWKSFDEDWCGIEEILQDKIDSLKSNHLKDGTFMEVTRDPTGVEGHIVRLWFNNQVVWMCVSSRDGFNRTQYIISDVPLATSK